MNSGTPCQRSDSHTSKLPNGIQAARAASRIGAAPNHGAVVAASMPNSVKSATVAPAVIHSVSRSNIGNSCHVRRPRAASSTPRRTPKSEKRRRNTMNATNAPAPANMIPATRRSCSANGAANSA